ncbi:dihydrolipoamide acetyltransferase family protein [Leifsonia sp. 1010]|uniref:dihydrolipoamide acetyltransferase family protein n=1 Tax=Leifsonia sp. 1010 TaxID=2817769 RepID=UPI002862681B|nr:dihydrolipoamide acetyltransferase family protein [Leifsonia sp. 1010]MDR6612746.1 pyruvate dehydrogenase E2 component (dihydrolipoamide acetyltransferase) [Leifsonia sp. 1010]
MAVREFALPDLGEGLTESELVAWKVAVGDTVQLNQIIAEVETAKALVELPAPYDGRVSRLFVEPGVTVAVGEPLVAFEVDAGESEGDAPAAPAAPASETGPSASPDGREPTLVGYGARPESGARPARRARPGLAVAGSAAAGAGSVATAQMVQTAQMAETAAAATASAASPAPNTGATATALAERPRATPPVRKFAREVGVDLASVTGSGDRGLITRGDVQQYAEQREGGSVTAAGAATVDAGAREKRIPIRGVRKATADAMVRSAFGAPQATVFLTVDVTPTMELVSRLRALPELAEARPGLLAVVAKALLLAVRRTPEVNSRWDDAANEIVQAEYVHLGIAAATPRGLMVPVIRDAEGMTLGDLSGAIRGLADTARGGRTAPADLSGGTITITNVGVFGVDAGTPILTPGEAAILAVGAVRRQPWEHDGGIALRQVLTLALTFDHRIVDGEQASRFLADIGRILADPASVLTLV